MHSNTSPARYRLHRSIGRLKITARYPVLRTIPAVLDRGHVAVGIDVAGARAVTQFTRRVAHVGILMFLVWPGFVIARVTACTIRLKCRELPRNEFGVGLVAGGAWQVAAMVLRLVRQGHMAIIRRCPTVGYVAGVAFLRGIKVTRVRAGGSYAVVTGRAGAKHLRVVDRHHRRKHIRGVAVLANIRCQDVRRVFAGCVRTVMAANAVACDVDVVKVGG